MYAFVAVVVILICAGSFFWTRTRSTEMLEGWAAQQGFALVRYERRTFFRGPFFWSTYKGQEVFHVTVRQNDGSYQTGWVRCGGRLLGLFSDAVEVVWES
jgi:hypothetical protein